MPVFSSAIIPLNCRIDVPRRRALLLCALLIAASAGCVQRRITIRSNPPGALVYVDKYEIGKTPCSVEYIYYGTREIKLVKDGYETLTVLQWIPPAFYEIPPLDFFSENVLPIELRDERTFDYQLAPTRVVPTNQLLGRAENLRQATRLENLAAGPPPPPPKPRVRVPPPVQNPTFNLPRHGAGVMMTPQGLQTGGGMLQPYYGQPQMLPAPGPYQPQLAPSPGPLPPRGPQ